MFPALRHIRLTTTVFFIPLSYSGQVLATSGTPTWTFSNVSAIDPGYVTSSPDLAFDHYGAASLTWSSVSTSAGNNSVRHSQFSPFGLWNHRELAIGPGLGVRTSISFDRAERPSIAWVNDNGSVSGQYNYGSNQSIAASGANNSRPIVTLCTDLAGSLRGMYSGAAPGAVSSIEYTGSTFSTR